MGNLLEDKTNRLWDKTYIKLLVISLVAIYVYLIDKSDAKVGILLALAPIALLAVAMLFQNPYAALVTLFCYNYFAMGLTRYVPAPLGLGVDGLIVLTYIGLLFESYKHEIGFARVKNDMCLIVLIWYIYALFELLNPQVISRVAWVYGMRGFALYFFLTVPVTFIVFNKYKDLNLILKLWLIFSILGVAKGLQQLYIGMDYAEQGWLDRGGALTHIIWSGLRVFSFFTDAGQFGATIAHSGVVFAIIGIGEKNFNRKIGYLIVAGLCFYGMSISGTRGAMGVPVAGFLLFLVHTKNVKLFLISGVFLGIIFGILAFTMIGNGNAQVRRMRSSFDKDDASLRTRKENQARLKVYMADKPFGCGVGTTGAFGRQYSPNLFVSQIPTDSWYVAIWVEFGEVGLTLHILIHIYIMLRGSWIILFKIRDRRLYYQTSGLLCGYIGIVVASYGNPVYGQMPTSIMLYMSLAFIFMAPNYQKEIDEANALKETQRLRKLEEYSLIK